MALLIGCLGLRGARGNAPCIRRLEGVASLSRIAYFLLPEINEDGVTRERATFEVSEKVDGCCSVEYPFRLPAKCWIPELDFGTAD